MSPPPPAAKRRPPNDITIVHEPQPKKQKLSHPARPPPAFWDSLSEIPLTRSALRELDRRHTSHATSKQRKPACTSIQPATQYLDGSSQIQLGRIRRSARQGGPDLSDLRALRHYEPTVVATCSGMSSSSRPSSLGRRKRGSASASPSKKSTQTTSTRSTGPYDRAFQQHLIDHGVYPHRYRYPDRRTPPPPPGNLDEIMQVIARPRPSLSPSRFAQDDFDAFEQAQADASKESQVTSTVIPIIEGESGDTKCVSGQLRFTNLDHLTDGSLVPGNPDRYYGARPEQLHKQVRMELNGHIVPSSQHDLPIVPNFFLAVKGPDGSLAVAERQACYDGALGARGIRSLQTYGDTDPVQDNRAYTITSTYHGGTLKMYTSHPLPPASPGTSGGYMTTQIKAYALTSDADAFRQGAAAYRNARDWAKRMRDETIEKANETVARDETSPSAPPDDPALSFVSSQRTLTQSRFDSNTASSFGDSDTSADELGQDMPSTKRTRRRGRQPTITNSES
ncbi:hypothetical protein GGR57DRAFT_258624 [Xylariaceae sp. FL1272]|nr:hypothetical protein GGR57DRAFT_258624 [Xylariaceae sp. FL1272]